MKIGGKYRFKLVYDGSTTLEWEQSSWLMSSTIHGFKCIFPVDCGPSSQDHGKRFEGLGKSSRSESVLDGEGGSHGNWWNSVGTVAKHNGGIPGWNGHIQKT